MSIDAASLLRGLVGLITSYLIPRGLLGRAAIKAVQSREKQNSIHQLPQRPVKRLLTHPLAGLKAQKTERMKYPMACIQFLRSHTFSMANVA